MGKKRRKTSSTAVWWLLVIVMSGLFAWLFWKASRGSATETTPGVTNRFDISRATDLLRWLGTNISAVTAPATNAVPATNPAATLPQPRQTNVVVTRANPFPIPATNLLATNRVNSSVSTQLFGSASLGPPGPERPVRNLLEAQIALARQAISCGPIDGVAGYQTRSALRAFQKGYGLVATGELDSATLEYLYIVEPVFTSYVVTLDDLARLRPVPDTWLGKSQVETLDYETILELVAERCQSSHNLIRSLNPNINWSNVPAHTILKVPNVFRLPPRTKAAFVQIQLAAKILEAYDAETNLLAHFPCSIAQRVEKRPVGELFVVTGAENPNYTFNPEVFPESEEARTIDHKLIIPPGPNNPVGIAWISLDKPGYGIHGTPRPEQVGRTESHGCFRLANWNAEYLLKLVWAGMPVYVQP